MDNGKQLSSKLSGKSVCEISQSHCRNAFIFYYAFAQLAIANFFHSVKNHFFGISIQLINVVAKH